MQVLLTLYTGSIREGGKSIIRHNSWQRFDYEYTITMTKYKKTCNIIAPRYESYKHVLIIRSGCELTGQRQGAVVLRQGEVQFCQHSRDVPLSVAIISTSRKLRTMPALPPVGRATPSARATRAWTKCSGGIFKRFPTGISKVFRAVERLFQEPTSGKLRSAHAHCLKGI